MSLTGLGLVRTDASRRIELPNASFRLPTTGGNPYLESAVRLYSFGRTERRKATLDEKGRYAHSDTVEKLICNFAACRP